VRTLSPHEAQRAARGADPRRLRGDAGDALIEPLDERERSWRTPLTTSSERPSKRRRSHRSLRPSRAWLALLVAALFAVAVSVAFAAYYLGAGDRGETEQVFIVEELTPRRGSRASSQWRASRRSCGASADRRNDRGAPRAASRLSTGRGFGATFAQHRAPVERAWSHARRTSRARRSLPVRFTLEPDGSVRDARPPRRIAATPLGACVRDVARGVRFAPQERAGVSFVIPITVERR
jgi:hypothetical protein